MNYLKVFPSFLKDGRYLKHNFVPMPELIVNLEEQLKILGLALSSIFDSGGASPILISGPTGTGKTTLMKLMESELQQAGKKYGKDIFISYVNHAKSSHEAFWELTRNSGVKIPERGFSFKQMFDKYQNKLPNRYNIFVVDEIHRIKDLESLLYEMTRRENVTIVAITLDVFFSDLITDISVQATFRDVKTEIFTKAYHANEVVEIMQKRIEKAFVEGFFLEGSLQLLAGKVAKNRGNIRFGLEILNNIVKLCKKNNLNSCDLKLMDKAINLTGVEDIRRKLETLDYHKKLLLYSFYKLFKTTNVIEGDIVTRKKVYNTYKNYLSVDAVSYVTAIDFLQDISDLGFIRMRGISFGKGKGRSTEVLHRYNSDWSTILRELESQSDLEFLQK